jgi:hypothetical protein
MPTNDELKTIFMGVLMMFAGVVAIEVTYLLVVAIGVIR